MKYILGIDTSSYTTSLALMDAESHEILEDKRRLLRVKEGQKGLRQQEAVFQHLKNLPDLYESLGHDLSKVDLVSVSSRPRNEEGSYMPVFIVGQNFGRVIASTLNCKYTEYSHQENHLAASLIESYKDMDENLLAVHLSGGTTEFVAARKGLQGFETRIVGGTKDITFGQLIDRLGTKMEFPFPCGKYMEEYLKGKVVDNIKRPPINKSPFINLSGMENYYSDLLRSNTKETVILSLFSYIAECITLIIESLSPYGFKTIIISGGVAANSLIRHAVLEKNPGYKILLPPVENSTDNALGLAFLPILDRWYHETKTH